MSEEYGPGVPDAYAERVLDTVDLIPAGRVMTYGDVAEWLGEGGPRQVGRVMSHYGGGVPWWRVVRADGVLLPGHELRALAEYRAEGTPLRQAGRAAEDHVPRLDLRRARWDGRVPDAAADEAAAGGVPDRAARGDRPAEEVRGGARDRTAGGAAGRAAGGARDTVPGRTKGRTDGGARNRARGGGRDADVGG